MPEDILVIAPDSLCYGKYFSPVSISSIKVGCKIIDIIAPPINCPTPISQRLTGSLKISEGPTIMKATAFIANEKMSLALFSTLGEKYCCAKEVPIYATGNMLKKKPTETASRPSSYNTGARIGSIVVKWANPRAGQHAAKHILKLDISYMYPNSLF